MPRFKVTAQQWMTRAVSVDVDAPDSEAASYAICFIEQLDHGEANYTAEPWGPIKLVDGAPVTVDIISPTPE